MGEASHQFSKPKKITIPWRLLAEIAIILLLGSILAKISITSSGHHELIIIDNSLSTGSLTHDNVSVLDSALAEARARILSNPLGEYSLATTNPPRMIASHISAEEAISDLGSVVSEYGEDDLEALTGRWIAEVSPDEVHIFTDRPSGKTTRSVSVHATKIKNSANLALSSGGITPEKSFVEITNLGSASRTGKIKLEISDGRGPLESSKEIPYSVQGDEKKIIEFEIPNNPKIIKATLAGSDANPLDDEYWLAQTHHGGIKVISPFSIEDLGLAQVKQYSFSKETTNPFAYIYHHGSIPEHFTANSLVILPDTPRWKEIDGGITRWEEESELLKFAKLSSFAPQKIFSVSEMPQGIDYIFSGNDSVLRSSVQDGFRVLYVGFELFPFEGKKTPISTVLFLNFLKSLSETETAQQGSTQKDFTSTFGALAPRPGILETGEAQNIFLSKESDIIHQEPFSYAPELPASADAHSSESLHQHLILAALLLLFLDIFLLTKRPSRRRSA